MNSLLCSSNQAIFVYMHGSFVFKWGTRCDWSWMATFYSMLLQTLPVTIDCSTFEALQKRFSLFEKGEKIDFPLKQKKLAVEKLARLIGISIRNQLSFIRYSILEFYLFTLIIFVNFVNRQRAVSITASIKHHYWTLVLKSKSRFLNLFPIQRPLIIYSGFLCFWH